MLVVRAACGVVVAIETNDQARACHQFLDDPLQDGVASHPGELDMKLAGEANGVLASVPGLGGVLDILDSLLSSAPVGYIFWLAYLGNFGAL